MWANFRTRRMVLYQIIIDKESAYDAINALAEAGIIHLYEGRRLLGEIKPDFINEYTRCTKMEEFLEDILQKSVTEGIEPIPCVEIPAAPSQQDLLGMETEINDLSSKVTIIISVLETVKKDYFEMLKFKSIFDFVLFNLEEHELMEEASSENPQESHEESDEFARLEITAGSLPTSKVSACQKTLWRIGRGNIILRCTHFQLPSHLFNEQDMVPQTLFILIFQGYDDVKSMAIHICAGYGGVFVDIPNTTRKRIHKYLSLRKDLEETKRVIESSEQQLREHLTSMRLKLCSLILKVKKMKMIFATLNRLTSVSKLTYGVECWISLDRVARAKYLVETHAQSGFHPLFHKIITNEAPPSLTYTTKVTRGFQAIANIYGVPTYREINPTIITIILFPFTFAIMVGDLGYGIIVVALTSWVIAKENALKKVVRKNEIYKILFDARYVILLMGIFSMYTGFVYNNIFSRPVNLFGSSWKINYNISTIMSNPHLQLDPATKDFSGRPYLYGQDPVWNAGRPENLSVKNAFKMKTSMIFGVIHMITGICLGIRNRYYFKDYASIWLDSIPQLIFVCGLFFYLVILIFYKWSFYGGSKKGRYSSHCAPLILNLFSNMVLFKRPAEPNEGCSKDFYDGQPIVEKYLVITTILMVPIMMCGKPLYMLYKGQRKKTMTNQGGRDSIGNAVGLMPVYNETLSDAVTHQLIHTFESVLGSVSHSASYLRIWALGFAHEQLSEILWNMVLVKALKFESKYGGIFLFLTFGAWAFLSLVILILMDGLSVFLHTLRLHWIQLSWFYEGAGYKFKPFSFVDIYVDKEALIAAEHLD